MQVASNKSWSLITGASSGIGKQFALELAKKGHNIIAVARRENKLKELKIEIENNYSVKCQTIVLDLLEDNAPEKLFDLTLNKEVNLLINNAGFGTCKSFEADNIQNIRSMIKLNTEVTTALTHLYLTPMRKRNQGYILQIASIASYLPTPKYAVYGATKSYLRHFSNSLNYELKNTNIVHTVFNPGFTATEFFDQAGQTLAPSQLSIAMSSQRAAQLGLKALFAKKRSSLPGFINWYIAHILANFIPFPIKAYFINKDMNTNAK